MRIEVKGDLSEIDFAELLRSIMETRETGVLLVSREQVERSFVFREGQLRHAASSDAHDSLPAYLLVTGAIGVQAYEDLQETARRGGRVTDHILERQLISLEAFPRLLAGHGLEIAMETFTWGAGRYRFIVGEQPPDAEGALDVQPELLLLKGARRVAQWERIHRGIGGSGRRVHASEWVKTPPAFLELDETDRVVLELARDGLDLGGILERAGGDPVGVGRSLWGLKLIRAVSVEADASKNEPAGPKKVDLEPMGDDETGDLTGGAFDAAVLEAASSRRDAVGDAVARFNHRHRRFFAVLQEEVGAGADVFVGRCVGHLGGGTRGLFRDLEPDPEGSWDLGTLQDRILEEGIEEPTALFDSLLEEEIEALCGLVDPEKAQTLRDVLKKPGPE